MRLCAAGWWTACACLLVTSAAGAAPQSSDEEALETLHQQILTLIGEPRCENIVHCRLLALGARPCGGPAEYLAYSSIVGKRDVLEAKAYEYSFLQEEVNRNRQATGACVKLREPKLACTNGRCTLDSER